LTVENEANAKEELLDRTSITIFKGKDERLLAQIMQSENGEYGIWEREILNNVLPGYLHKRIGKHSDLATARAIGNRIAARYNQDQT
jgi:hypothetical protein